MTDRKKPRRHDKASCDELHKAALAVTKAPSTLAQNRAIEELRDLLDGLLCSSPFDGVRCMLQRGHVGSCQWWQT